MSIRYCVAFHHNELLNSYPQNNIYEVQCRSINTKLSTYKSKIEILENDDDNIKYVYMISDYFAIMCICDYSTNNDVATKFLNTISSNIKYINPISYGEIFKRYMNEMNLGMFHDINITINGTKNTMIDNIGKTLEKDNKLHMIAESSEQLQWSASSFEYESKILKRQLCLKRLKIILMICTGLIILGLILYGIICLGIGIC